MCLKLTGRIIEIVGTQKTRLNPWTGSKVRSPFYTKFMVCCLNLCLKQGIEQTFSSRKTKIKCKTLSSLYYGLYDLNEVLTFYTITNNLVKTLEPYEKREPNLNFKPVLLHPVYPSVLRLSILFLFKVKTWS